MVINIIFAIFVSCFLLFNYIDVQRMLTFVGVSTYIAGRAILMLNMVANGCIFSI
nr:MAG TPA: hypothetical protein [Caudoviricetes sp.]